MKDFIKNKIRESLMKNIIGVEVSRPNQTLIIMRGIPGSGKSTKAKELVGNGVIHSTDDVIESKFDYNEFFEKMLAAAERKEDNAFAPLHKAHAENNRNAIASMKNGVSPVILDNTNIKANEPKEIVEVALKLGFADENIKFVEVGTGGLSAEELAQRNTHGVSLEKIKSMMDAYKSIGPLTLNKVVKAKPMHKRKKVLYSALVLDEPSKKKLFNSLGHFLPEGWKLIGHHMTIIFGKGLPEHLKDDLNTTQTIRATHIGVSDMAAAVKVEGYESANDIPHITLAVNPNGGKPVMSNQIKNWEPLDSQINLSGTITEITPK